MVLLPWKVQKKFNHVMKQKWIDENFYENFRVP